MNAAKLHRAYLPPSNAKLAGGRPEDLQTPLELPKETYLKFSGNDKQKKKENAVSQNIMELNGNFPNTQTLKHDTENRELGINLSLSQAQNSAFNDDQEIPLEIKSTLQQGIFESNTFGPIKSTYSLAQKNNDRNQYIPKSIDKINTRFEANSTSVPTAVKESKNTAYTIPIVRGSFEEYNQIKQMPNSESITETLIEDKITPPKDDVSSEIIGMAPDFNKPEEIFTENFSRVGDPTSNYPNQIINPTVDGQSISNIAGSFVNFQNTENLERNKQKNKNENDDSLSSKRFNNIKNIYSNLFPQNFRNKYVEIANRPQTENDRKAALLSFENIITPEGFSYTFDTSNGIHADESGSAIEGVRAKGSYSYTGDDGKVYTVTYTADEKGFLPKGDHIHPLPNSIKALIEKTTADGIYDDGSYSEEKYGHMRYQGPIDRYYSQIHMKTGNRQRKPANKGTSSFNKTQYMKTNNSERLATNTPFIINTPKSVLPFKIKERSQTSTLRSRPSNIIGNQYPNAELKGSENVIKNSQDNAIVESDDYNINDMKLGKLKTPTFEIIKESHEKQFKNVQKPVAVTADPFNGQTITSTEIPDYFTTEFNNPLLLISNDDFIPTTSDGETGYTYTKPKNVFKEGITSTSADAEKERYVSVNPGEANAYTSSVNVPNDLSRTQESTSPQTPILRSKFTANNNPYLTTDTIEKIKLLESSLTPTLFMPSTTPMPSLNKYIDTGIKALDDKKTMDATTPANVNTGYYTDSDLALNTAFDHSPRPTTPADEVYEDRTNLPYLTTEQDADTKLLSNNYDPNFKFSVRMPVNAFGNRNLMQIDNDDPFYRKTDKVIGEDFSGPKQPQSFDPASGYYY
uniref:Cuticle protein n=2 Tax=Bombyx mori TaxID=7091 RepID=A0A8R2M3X4_BOMMO|nr:cuticular protein RR-1 motif 14 isoform X1 [Bombyx mori]